MQLPPFIKGQFQEGEAGSVASLALMLFNEYGLSGYSLAPEEIETALISDYLFYSGWASTTAQQAEISAPLDNTYIIAVSEWAVVEPLIRAHCELMQANRMEATASLGGERFGLSVGEATSNYLNAKNELKKEAFVEEPFTIDLW